MQAVVDQNVELETRNRSYSKDSSDSFNQMSAINPHTRIIISKNENEIKRGGDSSNSLNSHDLHHHHHHHNQKSESRHRESKSHLHHKDSKGLADHHGHHEPIDRSHTLNELLDNWNDSHENGMLDEEFQKEFSVKI